MTGGPERMPRGRFVRRALVLAACLALASAGADAQPPSSASAATEVGRLPSGPSSTGTA